MAKAKPTTPPTDDIRVAYHEGPCDIGFCGKRWKRGEAQPITQAEWQAMQLRADFKHYQFTEEN
jgi:hypothetical protein